MVSFLSDKQGPCAHSLELSLSLISLRMKEIFEKYIPFVVSTKSSGEAEGLDLPGSDMDIMFVINTVNILQNVQHMNRSARHTTLLIERVVKTMMYDLYKIKETF
jgi:hypothetical protein